MSQPSATSTETATAKLFQGIVAEIADLLRDPAYAAADLSSRWSERQRAWHGPAHLEAMVAGIRTACSDESERRTLLLTALFHDAIYDPTRADNEPASAALLDTHVAQPTAPEVARARQLIIASVWQDLPSDPLARRFFELDSTQLHDDTSLAERARYERAIFAEYQFASWPEYREKRAAFLRQWGAKFPMHRRGVAECLGLLEAFQPRIGIYPGSFNPFHRGHLSILRQAEQMFDKVVLAVGINRQKQHSAAPELARRMDDRRQRLHDQLCFHEVVAFEGLLTDFVANLGYEVTILRGVRDGIDLEAELRFTRFLNELRPGTRVVWLACEAELQHLSSSAIRELESIQAGAGGRYIPDATEIYGLTARGTAA